VREEKSLHFRHFLPFWPFPVYDPFHLSRREWETFCHFSAHALALTGGANARVIAILPSAPSSRLDSTSRRVGIRNYSGASSIAPSTRKSSSFFAFEVEKCAVEILLSPSRSLSLVI